MESAGLALAAMELILGMGMIFCLIPGLLCLLSPQTAWKIREGWKFRNVEPSKLKLLSIQLRGLLLLGGAFLLLLLIPFAGSLGQSPAQPKLQDPDHQPRRRPTPKEEPAGPKPEPTSPTPKAVSEKPSP